MQEKIEEIKVGDVIRLRADSGWMLDTYGRGPFIVTKIRQSLVHNDTAYTILDCAGSEMSAYLYTVYKDKFLTAALRIKNESSKT